MPRLFSYGSLQQAAVQLATFGHPLPGTRDELVGFAVKPLRRGDKQLANAVRSTAAQDRVTGTTYELTDAELLAADAYERAESYARIAVTLVSGADAWMYVEAASSSDS
jgi:hypothetical protein